MVTYCTAADVRRILASAGFTSTTNPSDDEVDEYITESEDEMDHQSHHAWREATIEDEFYDIDRRQIYFWGSGLKIYLNRRKIRSLTKLEVWDGDSYDDWVQTKTEGRNNDYYLDLNQGILYIRKRRTAFTENAIRLTYKFGESKVPGDIKRACALSSAILILSSDDRETLLADTDDQSSMDYGSRIEKWQDRYDRIMANRTEISMFD